MTIVKHVSGENMHFYKCRYAAPQTTYDVLEHLKVNPLFTFSFAMFQESGNDIGCNYSKIYHSWKELLEGFDSVLRGRHFYENVGFSLHGAFQDQKLEIHFTYRQHKRGRGDQYRRNGNTGQQIARSTVC